MLDDYHRRSACDKRPENAEQYPDIQRVQTDGRFIENKNRILLCFADLACQLQTLRFPAGKPGCFLAEREIPQPEPFQNAQPLADGFHIPAEVNSGINIHIHQLRQG